MIAEKKEIILLTGERERCSFDGMYFKKNGFKRKAVYMNGEWREVEWVRGDWICGKIVTLKTGERGTIVEFTSNGLGAVVKVADSRIKATWEQMFPNK